ncbi:RNA-binding S4 domain-containing protein [Parvularcula sp. LCG005]|uniref:RNA-binding S4 domain-containing protein n=1 Tax=Parvularcula sp. LCG005 TaxID=3078805 RepID=UPI002941C8BC|nr:RNA-binding S4 domain-containing protein [Parvularcula sp. LCG005]WOI54080.1 RNA-binding S4 domain-containing protein [Parvularcula sp. LCG005]
MTEAQESLRIDRWLWHARMFKTRSIAARAVADHGIRLTRSGQTQRVEKASFNVRPGDTLAFTRGPQLVVVEVRALGERRGPAPEAQALYIDHSPPPLPRPVRAPIPFERAAGAGRPTKKDRRALDAVQTFSPDDFSPDDEAQ